MTKERWVQLLSACGLDEADRGRWRREFEKLSPEAHQDFLESLGLPAAEIALIRKWSAGAAARPGRAQRTATALKKV